MKFFDPKEDVMDLKLTQYGKHLLSKGRLIPKFYAFFDDDIIYDSRWVTGSFLERQSDTEDRIQDETPRLKLQTCFYGVETEIKKINELVRQKKAKLGDDKLQPSPSRHHVMAQPLGNSSLSTNKMPGWEAYFLVGKLTGSVDHITGSSPNIKIPQLNCEINYRGVAYAEGETQEVSEAGAYQAEAVQGDQDHVGQWGGELEFEDGSTLVIEKDSLLIEIDESNTDYLSDNFDIEVYEIKAVAASGSQAPQQNKGESEELIPLYFSRLQADLGVNYSGQAPMGSAQNIATEFPDVDPNYVEYFFEINVDREIDIQTICQNLPTQRARRGRLMSEFKCPDLPTDALDSLAGYANNLYDSELADLDDYEDCDQ
jgi:hypothetical protein